MDFQLQLQPSNPCALTPIEKTTKNNNQKCLTGWQAGLIWKFVRSTHTHPHTHAFSHATIVSRFNAEAKLSHFKINCKIITKWLKWADANLGLSPTGLLNDSKYASEAGYFADDLWFDPLPGISNPSIYHRYRCMLWLTKTTRVSHSQFFLLQSKFRKCSRAIRLEFRKSRIFIWEINCNPSQFLANPKNQPNQLW